MKKVRAHLRISLWHLLMNFEKSEKSEFWKTEQKIAGDIIILHMCTKKHNHMRYSSWDTEWDKLFLSFWAIFYPPPFPNIPENQNFQKMKKTSGDIIILNLCNKKQNQMMYAYSDMECGRHNFLSFQAIFFSFSPLLTPKIKIWKKCKKTPGDIILLHMCTKDQDHIMYGSWDIKCKGQSFLSFWAIFLPIDPPNKQPKKSKSWKNKKKRLEILSFYTSAPQMTIIWCMIPKISSVTDRIFCHFGLFFCPFTP